MTGKIIIFVLWLKQKYTLQERQQNNMCAPNLTLIIVCLNFTTIISSTMKDVTSVCQVVCFSFCVFYKTQTFV